MPQEHWTEDEELLAQVVLGRLSESQREPLDRHLASCEECRRRVADEQLLAAGVQRAGRDDLKARLRQRLGMKEGQEEAAELGKVAAAERAAPYGQPAPLPQDAAPAPLRVQHHQRRAWMYAAATAACVVIIAGVGILNRWWTSDQIITESATDEIAVATPPAPSAEKSTRETYAAPAEQAKVSPQKTRSSSPACGPAMPSTDGTRSKKDAEQKEVMEEERFISADEDRLKEKAVPLPEAITGAAVADAGDWVEGETAYIRVDKGANTAKNEANNVLRAAADQVGYGQTMTRINATISQRPIADAPVLRQQQRRQQSQTVLANLQQTDSTLRLTLYPDSQLNERDLRQAQVYRVTPDTILVVLPGQMIRYRMQSQAAMPVR